MVRTLEDRQSEAVQAIKAAQDQVDAITRQFGSQLQPIQEVIQLLNARLGLLNELIAERDSAPQPAQ